MNREIKFRGQVLKTKGWIYGDLICNSIIDPFTYISIGIGYKVDDSRIGKLIRVYPHSVGQMTGLKDKKGKDIYEGDIFKYLLPDIKSEEEIETFSEYTEEVVYEDGGFTLEVMPLGAAFNEGEVIGNIHDNPELINSRSIDV